MFGLAGQRYCLSFKYDTYDLYCKRLRYSTKEKTGKDFDKCSNRTTCIRRGPDKELEIPIFIDDYNHNIGGVDISNQLRESYETHRATQRNWWPLFIS